MRRSPSTSLLLVPSGSSLQVGFLCLGSVLLLFRGALVWFWVSVPSCLSVVFSGGGRFSASSSALFSASASFRRCLTAVVPHGWLLPTFLLSWHSLPSWPFVSLWCLFPLTWSSPLVLRFCARVLVRVFGLLACVLLCHYFLSSFDFSLVWFLFTSFITRSNLSSFATGPSLWAELSHMVVSWGCSGLGLRWSWSFILFRIWSLVLFFFSFCSWLGGLSSASVHSFEVPIFLSIPGAFRLPVWTDFLSWRSLLSAIPSQGCSHYLFLILCIYNSFTRRSLFRLVCCPCLYFLIYSWKRAPGKFPSPPSCFSFCSSRRLRPLRLASSTIPSGSLCPWR